MSHDIFRPITNKPDPVEDIPSRSPAIKKSRKVNNLYYYSHVYTLYRPIHLSLFQRYPYHILTSTCISTLLL